MKVYLFLANGFEEIEAITPIDILRRAEVEVCTVSINDTQKVTGAHGVILRADAQFTDCNFTDGDMFIVPGGMPGTSNLDAFPPLGQLLVRANAAGLKIASICAAPMILGQLAILEGKKATCYPGFESYLGESYVNERVVVSDNITTSQGPGTALEFSLCLVEQLMGKETAEALSKGTLTK